MNIKQWLQDVLRATFSLKQAEDTLAHLEHRHRMPKPKDLPMKCKRIPLKKPKARKRVSKAKKLKRAA